MSLRRQLCTVVACVKRGTEEDAESVFAQALSGRGVAGVQELLDLIVELWQGKQQQNTRGLDDADVDDDEMERGEDSGSAPELLRIALRVEAISQQATVRCLELIHKGTINGRSAIFCLSELRLYVLSLSRTQQIIPTSASTQQQPALDFLFGLAKIILEPYSFAAGDDGLDGVDMQMANQCLELLPAVYSSMSLIRKTRAQQQAQYSSAVSSSTKTT